jgi:hypothetical protein
MSTEYFYASSSGQYLYPESNKSHWQSECKECLKEKRRLKKAKVKEACKAMRTMEVNA